VGMFPLQDVVQHEFRKQLFPHEAQATDASK
jgi:hypothetical protein